MPVLVAEFTGGGLLALADRTAVDDQVVIVGDAVDSYRAEGVVGESHADTHTRCRIAGFRPGSRARGLRSSVVIIVGCQSRCPVGPCRPDNTGRQADSCSPASR